MFLGMSRLRRKGRGARPVRRSCGGREQGGYSCLIESGLRAGVQRRAEQFREVAGQVGQGQNIWGLGNQVEEVKRPCPRVVGYH